MLVKVEEQEKRCLSNEVNPSLLNLLVSPLSLPPVTPTPGHLVSAQQVPIRCPVGVIGAQQACTAPLWRPQSVELAKLSPYAVSLSL